MTTPDLHPAAAGTPLRGDVRSARSRMRTKYGSQRQIGELAAQLGSDETLQFMAVANGPTRPGRHNHGLLALTDRRLLFVPSAPTQRRVDAELDAVRALLWTKGLRSGELSVIGEGVATSFSEISSADGRELMALAVQLRPRIKRVGHL